MNEEELIQRVRRTLHERAEDVRPAPGRLPSAVAAHGERRTAEYPVLPPAGPPPTPGQRGRRWPPVVGIGVVVAAAAAASVAVAVSGHTHPVTVPPAGHGTGAGPGPVPSATAATTPPSAGPTALPASTVPMSPKQVPAGFRPESVTFVSPDNGWALGSAPGPCLDLVRTTDGGHSWREATGHDAPGWCAVPSAPSPAAYQVRFADDSDGWTWTAGAAETGPQLSSTHDGGATWAEVPLPAGATVGDLEASGGQAQMVIYAPCSPGSTGCQGQTVERILTTPVGSDSWTTSSVSPSIGAGPVPSSALTLWGTRGWLINDNRTAVSGAWTFGAQGGWYGWVPPCAHAGGTGLLAASSDHDLTAVCAEGMWGTPDAGTTAGHNWLFRSPDGGKSFTAVGPVPGNQPASLTTPPGTPGTVVLADGGIGLEATFDGGSTWTTLEPGPGATGAGKGYEFDYVGFTTSTQGVAVATLPAPAVYMTRDGGHTWSQVSF